MEKITKEELDDIIQNGIATDIFIAERAYCMFKTIGEKHGIVSNTQQSEFFHCAQSAFKDQFLLATARLFDSPSKSNKTLCVGGIIKYLSNNSRRLPNIVQWPNLIAAMIEVGVDDEMLKRAYKDSNDFEIAEAIVKHFTQLLELPETSRLLTRLKEIRDKRLAHNEIVRTSNELIDTIEIVTFKDLKQLVDIAKNLVGIIGWAYMSTVFIHDGEYLLTSDAERPRYSLEKLIDILKK